MKLKELREWKKLSQKQIGDIIGVSGEAVGKYERGVCDPSVNNLIKIANIFNVSVDTLLGHDANIVDLNVLNKNQKILIEKIVKFLTEDEISKILGYVDSFKK